jgi:hypothetical protein
MCPKGISNGKLGLMQRIMLYKWPRCSVPFAGVNIMSVHEVIVALDDAKSRIAELEMTLATIKESTSSEKTKEIQ